MTCEYLRAKRTVDDRALNRRVFERFEAELERDSDCRIVEVGCGVGTMICRLVEWCLLPQRVSYRAIDADPTVIQYAATHLPDWLDTLGCEVDVTRQTAGGAPAVELDVTTPSGSELSVAVEAANAYDIRDVADVVIACAFLDLTDLPSGLRELFELLGDGGAIYAPLTFDGSTGFVPTMPFDRVVTTLYHHHMRVREQPGSPAAGREVLEYVTESDSELLAAGGSDWIIGPIDSSYRADERRVLEHLLDTILDALTDFEAGRLPLPSNALQDVLPETQSHTTRADDVWEGLAEWEHERRSQLETSQLTLLAHNLDVLLRA